MTSGQRHVTRTHAEGLDMLDLDTAGKGDEERHGGGDGRVYGNSDRLPLKEEDWRRRRTETG